MAGKYLNIGCIIEQKTKDGKTFEKGQLDNESLKELVELITNHAETYLKGLSVDEIRAGQKLKWDDPNRIPRLEIAFFDPSDKAPEFIVQNLAMKRGE